MCREGERERGRESPQKGTSPSCILHVPAIIAERFLSWPRNCSSQFGSRQAAPPWQHSMCSHALLFKGFRGNLPEEKDDSRTLGFLADIVPEDGHITFPKRIYIYIYIYIYILIIY